MDIIEFIDSGILQQTLFGVTVSNWLLTLAAWTGLSLGLILIRRFITKRAARLASLTSNLIDDMAVRLLEATRTYFLIALALYLATIIMPLPESVNDVAQKLAFVVFLLQVIFWGNTLISSGIKQYREEKLETDASAVMTIQAAGFIGRLILWSVVFLIGLSNFGIDVTALIAGLGVGGIAVALAVQNILGDLFASLSIVLDKPFVVGDFLIIGDFLGTVENVGLKTTRIRSLSGEQIVFSNSDLLQSRIRNYKRMYERRVVFSIGVVYQTPPEALRRIPEMLRTTIEKHEQTRFDRAHFKSYGPFSLDFEIVYYVLAPDYNLYMDIQQAVNLEIYEQFEQEGIEFAYPTQHLYLERVSESVQMNGEN